MRNRKVIEKHYDSSYMKQPSFMGIYINDLVAISTILFIVSRLISKASIGHQYIAYGLIGCSLYSFLAFKNSFLPKDYVYYLYRKFTVRKKAKMNLKGLW